MKIAFGTDGWRAQIDDSFHEQNVERVIQALADYWRRGRFSGSPAVIGYDRRRDSEAMARVVAEVLIANGFPVLLASQFCPTPTVSWMVKDRGAIGGVVITASHNPWQWNGIKFKEGFGGSASPEYTSAVEAELARSLAEGQMPTRARGAAISTFNPKHDYFAELARWIDLERIKRSGLRVLNDPLFGAGTGYLRDLLGANSVDDIHAEADFRFGGLNPEPIEQNLQALMEAVPRGGYSLGVSTDGDADRIGAVDETGRYLTSHQIFALLLRYLVEVRGLKGPVVKSISTTRMIDKLCEKYRLPMHETPIGFKHICKEFVRVEALLGGEESGGIGFGPHVYERDGILNALFLMEMVVHYKKPLSGLLKDLEREIGPFAFSRLDFHLEGDLHLRAKTFLAAPPPEKVAGYAVLRVQTEDGLKLHFADGSWLLFRLSGTEPLLRIYAEAPTEGQVSALLSAAKQAIAKGSE